MGAGGIGAAIGGVVGGVAGLAQGNAQKKADNAYYNDLTGVRNQIRDAYSKAQGGWVDYIPEMQQGITGNINFANSLKDPNSAYNKYLTGAAANSLGLGYQMATESIADQLKGETAGLIEQTRNELIPASRSAAIDAGAYGGSRDMLTRERLNKNLENQITNQAAADISQRRAQAAGLLGMDAASLNNYLNAGTAGNNLLVNAANQQQQADMAKSNYLWQLAMDYAGAMGAGQTTKPSSVVPWVNGIQGAMQGAGFGMGLGNMSQLNPTQFAAMMGG